jgi:hypothetical protein
MRALVKHTLAVTPAKAGVPLLLSLLPLDIEGSGIPAFAGMTGRGRI